MEASKNRANGARIIFKSPGKDLPENYRWNSNYAEPDYVAVAIDGCGLNVEEVEIPSEFKDKHVLLISICCGGWSRDIELMLREIFEQKSVQVSIPPAYNSSPDDELSNFFRYQEGREYTLSDYRAAENNADLWNMLLEDLRSAGLIEKRVKRVSWQ